jgi:hypothetical protein
MTDQQTERFISAFFASPNAAWPSADPGHASADYLRQFIAALDSRNETPLIVPRKHEDWQTAYAYVICWDTAHAGRIRYLLESAVAHNWCHFDGRVARLDPSDTIDSAVLNLVGAGTTFILRPTQSTSSPMFRALSRLVKLLASAPPRQVNIPRPIGRMLTDFELALASGLAQTSADLLKEIEQIGGISHENTAFLQVRRLGRLGRDEDLLNNPALPTLLLAEPPRLVREAVLGAWGRAHLADCDLEAGSLGDAIETLRSTRPDVAMVVDGSLAATTDLDALSVAALVAIARDDVDLAKALSTSSLTLPDAVHARLRLVASGEALPQEALVVRETIIMEAIESPVPVSWAEWFDAIQTSDPPSISIELAQAWPPAYLADSELADRVDETSETATPRLLAGVAAFIETDGFSNPAWRTAAALLRLHLLTGRLTPSDLGAVSALLEIFLRGAPDEASYVALLEDIQAFGSQWVTVANPATAVDIADRVACGPTVNLNARSIFVAGILGPLHSQRHRLSAHMRVIASLATSDVGLGWDWSVDELAPPTSSVINSRPTILLYSLDAGVLARVGAALAHLAPGSTVHSSSAKVGSTALRQQARNSDLIIIATRCAAHAATGFITDNAGDAHICYPDGSGSGSMMRAVEEGLEQLTL